MPRSRLGPLAIESKLGDHPSQSSVWRAVHVQLKRSIAVKVFSAPFGATPEARASFASEWETLKTLEHPSLVRCYGGGFEDADAYLAHELIEGETLAAQLEHRTRLPWESVLEMAEPLIEAISYLHEHQIVHGNIQPSKIMFAGLSPVLIDVRVDRDKTPFRSSAPPTPSEAGLMAPELLRNPGELTEQVDLYAFGAVLYLAITGRAPATGETINDVTDAALHHVPESPASIVLDCPVWLDKLIMQLLEKNPDSRPYGAQAVILALAEVRRRAMSRTGVVEHTSAGFSPLNVNDQKDRDEARALLGQIGVQEPEASTHYHVDWYDRPWVLVSGLILLVGMFIYFIWPLNEDQMRAKAESLLLEGSRNSMNRAKASYLAPMLQRFPEGEHSVWAREQIDRVEMEQAEHALSVKIKRNLPLQNEAERLYAEASEYERFGDTSAALDKYRGMETLLGDNPQYLPFVNLARRQIARIEYHGVETDEASEIIEAKLSEADRLQEAGKVIAARKIWYSLVELYGTNEKVAPLIAKAQQRLAGEAVGNDAGSP